MKRSTNLLLVALVALSVLAVPVSAGKSSPRDPEEIALEAYIYLYPLVLMDVMRLQLTNCEQADVRGFSAPMNAFGHARAFPPLDFTTSRRPNFDMLLSSLWMDITAEPMILSVPDSGGRYYLIPAMDMWSDVFASIGWRTTGTQAGHYAYCRPDWQGELPEGVIRIDAPTPYIWLIGRTQAGGEKDFKAVHKFQNAFRLTPLSYWGNEWIAPKGRVDPEVDMLTPPIRQVAEMSGEEFFEYAARLLELHPPHINDHSQVWRLRHIGIVPGRPLQFDKLSRSVRRALEKVPETALVEINDKVALFGTIRNGWLTNYGAVGSYGVEYLQRAAIAMYGLGANQKVDAVYPQLLTGARGEPLSGSGRYVLHFEKDQLPPANAFWSVTLYNEDGYPVPNALNRGSLSSLMNLKYNRDGSLDLYFQPKSPGAKKQANWLPTPKKDSWNLTMRIHAPDPEARDGTWSPPAIERMDD
jgi:hypothetical protein